VKIGTSAPWAPGVASCSVWLGRNVGRWSAVHCSGPGMDVCIIAIIQTSMVQGCCYIGRHGWSVANGEKEPLSRHLSTLHLFACSTDCTRHLNRKDDRAAHALWRHIRRRRGSCAASRVRMIHARVGEIFKVWVINISAL